MSFFHVSVAQFKAEHSINQLEHQLTMLVSYVIYCMCTCNLLGLLSVGPVNFGAIGYVFLWLGFAYLLAYITLKIFNLINYSRIGFGDRPPLSIRLGARADYNLRKVVYPLIIWAFFGTVFAGQAAGALFWLPGITCLSLGTLLTFQITMYQKNTIPSDAFIAIFETTSEVPLLMVGVVAMVVGLFAQHQPNFSLKLSLNSLVFAINIANAVFFTLTKKFWSTKANLMILRYSYWILILDLWNYIHFLGVSQGFLAMGIILGFSLAEKIARNMNIYFSQIDPFDSKVSLRKRTLGFCILEDVISQQINGSLSKSDEPLYYFYRGLLYQYFLRKGKPEKATIICSDITKLHPFLAKMIGDEFKTNPMIKLTLRLQLLNLFDNLVFIRLLFSKLREGAKTSLDEKLDCFHLSQLVESKIMAYYQLKDIPANHKMKSLKIQYRHINDLCTLPIGSYYLDVSEPLKSKNMFISMSGTIKRIITNKQKLFDYVFETSGASKPNAHRLLTENEGVRNLMLKAGKLILRDIEAIQVLPLYFFPSLCTYFAIVRYDFDHLRQMRSRYKKEILKWKILLDRPLSLRMDALDADAVVLQISIQPNTSGLIVEASSNAEKKLEAPKAGQVVGRNVNELFTSMVAEQHKQLMRSSKGLGQLINTKRPFYIKDFAKELRQIYFMLKVMPVIDKDIFVLSSLSLIDNEKESLVVLSDSMQIVDAEQAFWNKLEDPKRFSKSNAKIEQLIPRIPLTIKLLQAFKEVEKALETEEIIVEKGSALASLTQFISQFCALNRDSKLEFTAAADPIWRRTSRELTFLCKIEEFHFKEVSLFSLFITFTSSDTVRGGTFYHNKELKKSAKPDEEPMIKLQQHEGPSGSDFDSEEYERIHREDEYLDKIHSIGSQIRSLKNILGNTQPTDLKFCTPALRKGLSEIIRLLGLFYDLYEANVSIKKIDHRKQTFVNAALNHERFASLIRVDLKSPLPDSRAVLAEQPKHSTTTMLDLLEKSKGLEAVTEVQEDPTSFQEVEDLIRNHRKRVETPTYYRGKLKENAIQSPSFRKKHKNPKPKNISSFQQAAFGEDGPDFPRRPKLKIIVQSISAWLRLSKKSKSTKQSITQGTFKIAKDKGPSVDASSIAPETLTVKNMKRSTSQSMLLTFYAFLGLYFLVYSVINLACWFSYEANTKNNFLFPHQILQLTNVLSIYYFMGSDSLISYVDIISLKESERLGMITEDQLHAIEALLPFEEPEEFFDEKYEDISGEFKTAAKELLELVLDSTNMPNGVSLATTKFSLNYLSEDELLWIDPKMHKLVELPSVNLVQSNTYIQVVLDLGTSLIETVYEDYDDRRLDVQQFKEINHFIMKYAHFDLLDPIQHIVSSQLIELLNEADRIHAVSVRAIIVLLCLLTAANSLLLFGFLYHYQKRISNILASYCCLTSKDIVFETGMISSAQQFFNGKLYDHSRMEEAIKIANFDKKDFDDSFEKKPKDKKRDSKNVVRKRKGVNSTDGTEFLMVKYPYRSIVTALLLNLMTLVFSVITVVFILLVEQEKKVASFLTSMSVLNNLKTMNVHENFARFLAFAPSAVMSTNITQHIEYLDISKFEKDSDEFHYFWASARDQLNSVVDPSIGMNELVYRDFCAMVFSYKELYTTGGEEIVLAEDTELIEGCKSGYLWGNQGFNQYILYEESQLREISILTLDALESYEKSGSKEELMQVLSDIWFNDRYVRLRFLHHEAFEFYLFASFMKFNQALKSRSSRGANLMATFAVVTVLLVILPIAVFYQMAVVSLERDHLVSLFTFDMIHPSTTINNQYLKAKFKKYFRLYAVF